jgi:serine/threonine protein kinase
MNGNAEDPVLLSVAESISEGRPVDWNQLTQSITDPEQSAIADELRMLEGFSRLNAEAPLSWGPFTVISEIGRGSFGTVYRAIDPNLQLEVALKVIKSDNPDAPIDMARALDEGRHLAKVRNSHVVRVYHAERIDNEVGLSMELIKGRTLDRLVREQGPYSAGEAMLIGLDLCKALAAVHAAGVIHGDVKAHNVMREEGGRTVLMDFGAGKDVKRDQRPGGDFAGTPLYIAPEIFQGRSRTVTSDIYSLGVLLYYLVTGSYPVEGSTRTEIARRHDQREPRKPLRDVRADLPDGFIRVIDRALAEEPRERYQSAGALEAALVQVLPSPAPPPPVRSSFHWTRVLLPAAIVIVLGLIGVAGYGALFSDSSREATPATVESSAVAGATAVPLPTPSSANTYRIDAGLYRVQGGNEVRLAPSARIAPGDRLSLQVQVSVPAYVYVINEDEQGESYLLFPLPGQTLANPLPPGQRHSLPGLQNGEQMHWQVTTAGGKEHFLIFASPERSAAFERMFATLPHPTLNKPVLSATLSNETKSVLRGVGGLTSTPVQLDQQLRLTPEFATPLTGSEETARGVWIRQLTLENPSN